MESWTPRALASIGPLFWGALVVAGLAILADYTGSPGASAEARATWPDGTGIPLDLQHPTVSVCLHAGCPCSRATVAELARIQARVGGDVSLRAVVHTPVEEREAGPSPLERSVREIPGVQVIDDPSGEISRRLGARTSGEVFVYAPTGALLFHGGITAGRGHQGMNRGRRQVEEILLDPAACAGSPPASAPTYGCPLLEASEGGAT